MCVQAEPRPRGEECSGLRSASRASTPFPSHTRAQAEFIKEEMQLTVLYYKGNAIDAMIKKHNLRPFLLDVYNVEYKYD